MAIGGRQKNIVRFAANLHIDNSLAFVEPHRDFACAVDLGEIGKLVAPHAAACGREHDIEGVPRRLVLRQWHDRGDPFAFVERQHIDERLAARLRGRKRQPPDFFLVDVTARGKEQYRRMGRGDKQPRDEILVARLHSGAALAAAPLRAIGLKGNPLDVTKMRHGDNHVLPLNEILVLDARRIVENEGPARRRMGGFHRDHLVLDDGKKTPARPQNGEIIGDLDAELVQGLRDFVASKRGQALQPEFENGPRLGFRKLAGAVLGEHTARVGDERDEGRHVMRGPDARHQGRASCSRGPGKCGSGE